MPHLLVIEDDRGRREFVLGDPVYAIGKDPKCELQLASQFVSRRPATLVQLLNDNGTAAYRIVDGNLKGKTSANDLIISGRRLQAHNLQNEDEVVFGPQVRAVYYLLAQVPLHDSSFPNSDSLFPRKPYSLTPSGGAEASPLGVSPTP